MGDSGDIGVFLVTLKKQSHQMKTLVRLELVTLVVLVTLDRGILFNDNGDVQEKYLSKKQDS
jgi:hypothetical protein